MFHGFNPLFLGALIEIAQPANQTLLAARFNPLFLGALIEILWEMQFVEINHLRFNPLFLGALIEIHHEQIRTSDRPIAF